MRRLSHNQAVFLTVSLFVVTIGVNFFLPGYTVVAGGFLLAIFITTFIRGRYSTGIAVLLSLVFTLAHALFFYSDLTSPIRISETIFKVFLIISSGAIVFYLKKLYENIKSEQTHLNSLFENANEGIILTNGKGEMVMANIAAGRMFEYAPEELKGNLIEMLIPAKYRHQHVAHRTGFHANPSDRQMGHGRDLRGVKKSGAEFPVEVSLSHYKKLGASYVIAFVVDITQRKENENNNLKQQRALEQLTADLRKLNTELEGKVEQRTIILKEALAKLEDSQKELSDALEKERELNEIKSRFVSMASHEFRTPLSTILSSASLLSKYKKEIEQENRDKHIRRISESVNLLNSILEDFLCLGRLNEGKTTAQIGEFNMKQFIIDTTEEMQGLLKPSQRIDVQYSGSEKIYSDKKLLKNVLINLISNAIKFSPVDGSIEVNGRFDDGTAQVTVADHGIGIPPEDQEHLFSSFYRGKNATNVQGTGLGLHIVKRYIELLNGDIHLDSKLNEGTKITFEIPSNVKTES